MARGFRGKPKTFCNGGSHKPIRTTLYLRQQQQQQQQELNQSCQVSEDKLSEAEVSNDMAGNYT